jgi:hypothetical protein
MPFKNLRQRLSSSVVELDNARLQDRYAGLDLTPIDEVVDRGPARLGGEVRGIRVVPRAGSPWLEVTVSDGTGEAIAMFCGRRAIAGVGPGRGLLLEGVPRRERRRLILLNPSYTLLPR